MRHYAVQDIIARCIATVKEQKMCSFKRMPEVPKVNSVCMYYRLDGICDNPEVTELVIQEGDCGPDLS